MDLKTIKIKEKNLVEGVDCTIICCMVGAEREKGKQMKWRQKLSQQQQLNDEKHTPKK